MPETPDTLWLSTDGDVSSPSGAPGLASWTGGEVIQLANPGLDLEPGVTTGVFYSILNLDTFAGDSNAGMTAMHYVSRNITIGTNDTIELRPGDVIFSVTTNETFTSTNSLSASDNDAIGFRPDTAGDYSSGTFFIVLDNFTGGIDVRALSLIDVDGIRLETLGSNTIVGNYIGTDVTGTIGLGNGNDGVDIESGSGNNIVGGSAAADRNVISGNADDGIEIVDTFAAGNQILGNYIGLNAAGTAAIGNTAFGTHVQSSSNSIGNGGGGGNVISGNAVGVLFIGGTTSANVLLGNIIGLNAAGSATVANAGDGIQVVAATGTTIGSSSPSAGNTISGNAGHGIVASADATFLNVLGNNIGTDVGGTLALGNSGDGIRVDSSSSNTIGGTGVDQGNTIAFNTLDGVRIDSGTANTVRGNSIHSNTALGIDLGGDGVTANDIGDGDTSSVANLLVSRGADGFISLREALIAANNTPGSNTITLPSGTLDLTILGATNISGDFDILDDVTITGNGAGSTIVDGNNNDRVFEVQSGTATFQDLTIQNGSTSAGGGAIHVANGSMGVFDRVTMSGNAATGVSGFGGAIDNLGDVTLSNSVLSGNSSSADGGAIRHMGTGTLTIVDSTIGGNTAGISGGALDIVGDASLDGVTLTDPLPVLNSPMNGTRNPDDDESLNDIIAEGK